MRDIEGIENVMKVLHPHWNEIENHFKNENEKFKKLIAKDPDLFGRVLKCHLIIEHYLDRFLIEHFRIDTLSEARLTFFQKTGLLPNHASAVAFVKPGIVRLNKIRNEFGHTLDPVLTTGELGPIKTVLEIARKGVNFESPIESIEAFTTVASTFLIIPPPDLGSIFMEAFSKIRIREE